MTTFGISMPDQLAAQLDEIASNWYTTRSAAFTRIFIEWRQHQLLSTDSKKPPTGQMPQRPSHGNSAQ